MTRGGAFRLVGLILGITGAVISMTAIVFSATGLALAKRVVRPNIRK